MPGDRNKKRFKIEDLSTNLRKKIFVGSMVGIMTLIIIGWISSLAVTLNTDVKKNSVKNQKLEETREKIDNFGQALNEGREVLKDITNQIKTAEDLSDNLNNTSTPTGLTKEEIEVLKNIILENTAE